MLQIHTDLLSTIVPIGANEKPSEHRAIILNKFRDDIRVPMYFKFNCFIDISVQRTKR